MYAITANHTTVSDYALVLWTASMAGVMPLGFMGASETGRAPLGAESLTRQRMHAV